jgi:hypothetical protein
VEAPGGTYFRDTNQLVLNAAAGGDVTVTTTDGLTARFKKAQVDIEGQGLSASDVAIVSDGSTITAGSLAVSDGGKVLNFERDVKVSLPPQGGWGEAKGEGDAVE